jgi:flagellar operon protein
LIDKIFFPDPILIPTSGTKNSVNKAGNEAGKTSFAEILGKKLPAEGLKFSQHAQERLRSRGIKLSENDVKKLEDAVDDVGKKGGKESLVMLGNAAFVVNVKNRTVITAVDKAGMQGNVFTNIDSAVLL